MQRNCELNPVNVVTAYLAFLCKCTVQAAILVSLVVFATSRTGAQTISYLGPTDYPVGTKPTGIAPGDFNGDNKTDLAVANSGSGDVSILLGNGDGSFQQARNFSSGGSNPVSVVVGDFNRDGKQDLAVALSGDQGSGGVTVMLGNGDGTFQAPSYVIQSDLGPSVVAVGDFNGDGKPDLVAEMYLGALGFGISVFMGNGDGTFLPGTSYAVQYLVVSIAIGDLNGDHIPDLALATTSSGGSGGILYLGAVTIMLGNGDGTFQPAVNYTAKYGNLPEGIASVALGDFDGDGKVDVAAAATVFDHPEFQHETLKWLQLLFRGNGDGTFQPASTLNSHDGGESGFIIADDLNADGKLDLAALGCSAVGRDCSLILLEGNGDGSFQSFSFSTDAAPAAGAGVSLAAADLNNDGLPDLIWTNPAGNDVGVVLNATAVFTLTVDIVGGGHGMVVEHPGGIICTDSSGECSMRFAAGTVITLTTEAASGARFAGWSGACSGTSPCSVTMNANQSVTATFNIPVPPDFSLSATPTAPAAVHPGGQATSTVVLSGSNGFNSPVSLTCSVSPMPQLAPQCSMNPSSLSVGNSSTLTVATTGSSLAMVVPSVPPWRLCALGWPLVGITLLAERSRRRSGQRSLRLLLLLCGLFLAVTMFQAACGGGRGQSHSGGRGTPTGLYTVSVTGTSGSIQHSTTLTFTVQ